MTQSVHPMRSSVVISGRTLTATLTHSLFGALASSGLSITSSLGSTTSPETAAILDTQRRNDWEDSIIDRKEGGRDHHLWRNMREEWIETRVGVSPIRRSSLRSSSRWEKAKWKSARSGNSKNRVSRDPGPRSERVSREIPTPIY